MENQQENQEERTITLSKVLGYIFGITFIIMFPTFLFGSMGDELSFGQRIPFAIMVLIAGLLVLPLSVNYIHKKFKIKMSGTLRFVIAFILYGVGITNILDKKPSSSKSNQGNSYNPPVVQKKPERKLVIQELGEALITDYFEVTINKYSVMDYVDTGNMFARLKREEGSQYLILYTSFKNIDSESRSIFDGNLVIYYNEKPYVYDVSETLLLDGWGIYISHRVNPLTTYKTNIVYKIPKELKGRAFYYPSRNNDKGAIYLGEIN